MGTCVFYFRWITYIDMIFTGIRNACFHFSNFSFCVKLPIITYVCDPPTTYVLSGSMSQKWFCIVPPKRNLLKRGYLTIPNHHIKG